MDFLHGLPPTHSNEYFAFSVRNIPWYQLHHVSCKQTISDTARLIQSIVRSPVKPGAHFRRHKGNKSSLTIEPGILGFLSLQLGGSRELGSLQKRAVTRICNRHHESHITQICNTHHIAGTAQL